MNTVLVLDIINSNNKAERGTEVMSQLTTRIKYFTPLPLALFTSAAFAAPPIAYDQWSVTNGSVDTSLSCTAAGISCKTIATDNGFQYEEVTTPVYSFFRLILTEQNATGAPVDLSFSNETYTPFALVNAGIAQGAATKQVVRDAASNFDLVTEVQKGNMRGLNAATADEMFTTKIDQSFSNAEFSSGFAFTNYTEFFQGPATNPDTNIERGRILDITQDVLVGDPGDTTKKQKFVHSQRKGFSGNSSSAFSFPAPGLPVEFMVGGSYFVSGNITTAGSMTLPDTQNGIAGPTSTTVSWNDGNDITTTWIGQSSNLAANTVDLNYQRVSNNTAGTEATAVVINLPEPVNPFDWDTNFGAQPAIP